MNAINNSDIKVLRSRTGAGVMDCKKALLACSGNIDEAGDWLRKKGIASSNKKADRETPEGVIALAIEGNKASIIELNSETDFVAKNKMFQDLANIIASSLLNAKQDIVLDDFLNSIVVDKDAKIKDLIAEHISIIGENIRLSRIHKIECQDDVIIASYMHGSLSQNIGKIGVLAVLKSDTAEKDKVLSLGKNIAVHIAALNPVALHREDVDSTIIEKEAEILRENAISSGKPENMVDKIVEGQITKFYKENVLMEQQFVMNDKISIKELIASTAKEDGCNIDIVSFVRFSLEDSK